MRAVPFASGHKVLSALLFVLLAQPWVPWALSALIAGGALLAWLHFRWRRVEPVLAGLDRAIALVEASEGPSGFRRRFQAIYQGLAENPALGEAWRAYAATIAPAPHGEDALGYSRRPQEDFHDGLLTMVGVNLRFYHAVPNLLVGSGLLFTFLGLVAALYFASHALAAPGIGDVQQALRELLSAATFKFVTSIAGLGSSLLFSWREKALLHHVQRRLARFCAALEERMVPVTAESLAASQLGELRAQHAELRRMSRNLILRVPEGIEARLAEDLADAIVPLRRAIAEAAGRLARLDEQVLASLAATAPVAPVAPARESAHPVGAAAPAPPAAPGALQSLPMAAEAPLPLLRRLDRQLGELAGLVRRGIEALARLRGKGGGRPADAVKALMAGQAGLEEARRVAATLGSELEGLAGALAAATTARAGDDGLPEGLAARLAGLGRDLPTLRERIESQVAAGVEQVGEAVRQLEAAGHR